MPLLRITDYQEVEWTHQYQIMRSCPLCDSKSLLSAIEQLYSASEDDIEVRAYFCPSCGYWELLVQEGEYADRIENERFFECRLENFHQIERAMPDLALAVSQMNKREDIHHMSPRQFEYLTYCYIKDILDCDLTMTKETRDGGYDLICLESEIGPFIVEVKKYRKTKVGVSIIRQLVGVQARDDIPKSILVTTGQVTADAIREKDKFKWTPYSLEIHDIDDITSWLNKKTYDQVKIDMKSILARIGFMSDKDLIYDPDKKSLSFCET